MTKKVIKLPHKVCGMSCMVNGLEDLYEWKTRQRLPDWLLFYGSGMGEFTYLRQNGTEVPRMVFWGTRAKDQYRRLAEVMGFKWEILEGRSFKFTLSEVIRSLDNGTAVMAGGIDMYYLPYFPKLYRRYHVPIHHFLFVGYDLKREVVYVQDCDRAEPQELSFGELEKAWNVTLPGLYRANTLYSFNFPDNLPDLKDLSKQLLLKKIEFMLSPPVSMFGIKGMRKLADEINSWKLELGQQASQASLKWLMEYAGNPPSLPEKLTGFPPPGNHQAGRDSFSALLENLSILNEERRLNRAAELFVSSGARISQLVDLLAEMVLGKKEESREAALLLNQIADVEEEGYELLRRALV